MKIKFFIQGQKLKRAKNDYIVADSKNFISADFEFSQEWTSLQKSAIFKNADTAYTVLLTDNECAVPYEVTGADFCVSVFGVGDNMRITTDEIVIRVEETGYCEGETPVEPTQSVYEQITAKFSDVEAVQAQMQEQLSTKADEEEVATALSLKADKQETEEMLLTKADAGEVTAALSLKADKTQTESALSQKANQEELQQLNAEIEARCSAIETTHKEDIQSVRNTVSYAFAEAVYIEENIIGDENKLQTTAKMLVPAINEVQQEVIDLQSIVTSKADASYVNEAIASTNDVLASVQSSLDNKINKSEWELLEEIEMTEELSAEGVISFKRTLSAAYGITDISAVMLISIYPVDARVKYGIHNSINYKTEYEKPVNLFAWKPTLTTSSTGFCSYWQIVNKESGFVAQANLPNATRFFEAALSPLSNQEFSAMPIKEITQINVQSYEDSTTTKAIPKGSVFRIYGKGVVRNA